MRRTERQHQQERAGAGPLRDEFAGVFRLGNGIVSRPEFWRGIVALVIERVVVFVGTLAGFPIVEPEALLRRNVGQPSPIIAVGAAVEMPLADEASAVPGAAERFAQRR